MRIEAHVAFDIVCIRRRTHLRQQRCDSGTACAGICRKVGSTNETESKQLRSSKQWLEISYF